MKHFLQILFTGTVLFVLLGLYNEQEGANAPDLPADDLQQVVHSYGILSDHHPGSDKSSKIDETDHRGQSSIDIRRPHEAAFSNHFRSEFKNSLWIYKEIMQALLHMKGVFPKQFYGEEILS